MRSFGCDLMRCSVCGKDFLSPKPHLKVFYSTELKGIPVVREIVQQYFANPEGRDSVVVSNKCSHVVHYACFARFARKFRIDNLRECDEAFQAFKCPEVDCHEVHRKGDLQLEVWSRTAYNSVNPVQVQINGWLHSCRSNLACMSSRSWGVIILTF